MTSPSDLRRWVAGRRAASRREQAELRGQALSPAASMRRALALVAVAGRTVGWPPLEDPVSRREDERVYRTWARLRAALRS